MTWKERYPIEIGLAQSPWEAICPEVLFLSSNNNTVVQNLFSLLGDATD